MQAAKLGAGMARQEARDAVARVARQAAFAVVVMTFVFLAFCFALGAFTVWLAREIGTVQALGLIALGFLVLAAIVYGISRMGGDKPRSTRRTFAVEVEEDTDKEHTPGSTVASLAVVVLVGFTLAQQLFRRAGR